MEQKVRVFKDPKIFWQEVSPHLLKEETKNSLFLGLSYIFRDKPENCIYQSAIFDGERFCGALVCSRYITRNHLLLSSFDKVESARKLFAALKVSGVAIDGVVGETTAATFYRSLLEDEGQEFKTQMVQGLYRCKKVKIPKLESDLLFRAAELKDIEKIAEWIQAFHDEAVPHDPPTDSLKTAKSKIDGKMIYVLEKAGQLVSMAGWSRDIETSCSINLVYTPKGLRKKGFASKATALLTRKMLDGGKLETNLYTDMLNSTSNKIYLSIGYEFVCDSIFFSANR